MEVHFTPEQEAQLAHMATRIGTDPEHLVKDAALRLLENEDAFAVADTKRVAPFKTGRGMFAKYGPAPSAEDIDVNRAEMFSRFAEDL
jgi:hypothetical protein